MGEFSAAVRKSSLHLGLYHSLFEWFNPLYEMDRDNNFTTRRYAQTKVNLVINYPTYQKMAKPVFITCLPNDVRYNTFDDSKDLGQSQTALLTS